MWIHQVKDMFQHCEKEAAEWMVELVQYEPAVCMKPPQIRFHVSRDGTEGLSWVLWVPPIKYLDLMLWFWTKGSRVSTSDSTRQHLPKMTDRKKRGFKYGAA